VDRESLLINDADNHFVEPADVFERYIGPKWRDKAVRTERMPDGRHVQTFAGRPSKLGLSVDSVPQSDAELDAIVTDAGPSVADELAPKPGDGGARTPGMFLNKMNPYKGLGPDERKALIARFRAQEESYGNRDLRLALMDEQGINAAIMYPGVMLGLEVEFADDVDAIYANARAFNRWIHEEIGFAHADRMFMPPYVSLADPELATAEVELLIDQGAPMVLLRAGYAHGGRANPFGGRSPADPVFDPVWARLDEAGVRVTTHLGATDYGRAGANWSEDPDAVLGDFDALQWVLYWGDRPAMETVVGMIAHNLFGRFPGIHVCIAEQGTVWLPYTLRKLDHAFLLGHQAKWGKFDRRPSEIFKEHFVVAPFPEENVRRVISEVGVQPLVFGSDFPHGEGIAEPRQYIPAQLDGIDDATVLAFMRDNLARFLRLPVTV